MIERQDRFHELIQALDDVALNPRYTAAGHVLQNPARRQLLKNGVGAGVLAALGIPVSACCRPAAPLLGFVGVQPQLADDFDRVVVAPGYAAEAFFSWGDAVLADAPIWRSDASDDWQAQLKQAGDNHDGMHYFPFADSPNGHGLLAINHEYANRFLHPSGHISYIEGRRPLDEVRKEQAAHGLSIIEIRKNAQGEWQRVPASPFNRRLSALTPMHLGGPLAGHEAMKTVADPGGRVVLGTLNNCSMGVTPWGTYLMCEENWHIYFLNRNNDDLARRVSHQRYGIANARAYPEYEYSWETADPRFDAAPDPAQPFGGYVNEPHRFGWVVEVDPFDPAATPVKRTALGRFCRECAVVSLGDDGRMAVYSGDDTRGEYVYKFVPTGRFDPKHPAAARDLLDEGTLYAGCFMANGKGEWKALVWGQNGLTPENGFASQAEVLLNARAAGDRVGATPLDRPEWVAVHPRTREVYVSLTHNDRRGVDDPVDAANPRAGNPHGQILRWNEHKGDPAATSFDWEIFLLAGEAVGTRDETGAAVAENSVGTIKGDVFSSPDGLAFDGDGRLWIQTDFGDSEPQNRRLGCNQLLCADPLSREVRRFLVGPCGCEITGITFTPDYRTLWINVQHPALSYPASDGKTRPRSTTVVISKNDGGVIGT